MHILEGLKILRILSVTILEVLVARDGVYTGSISVLIVISCWCIEIAM